MLALSSNKTDGSPHSLGNIIGALDEQQGKKLYFVGMRSVCVCVFIFYDGLFFAVQQEQRVVGPQKYRNKRSSCRGRFLM